MGHFCDGRASLVVGSHQHIPTADAQIFPGGTAFQADAGACADYDSVIGMDKAEPVQRFLRKMSSQRYFPATGPATLCGGICADRREGPGHAASSRSGGRAAEAVAAGTLDQYPRCGRG